MSYYIKGPERAVFCTVLRTTIILYIYVSYRCMLVSVAHIRVAHGRQGLRVYYARILALLRWWIDRRGGTIHFITQLFQSSQWHMTGILVHIHMYWV